MKQVKTENIPNWANEDVFQVSSSDDVLSSFYAPSSNNDEKKQDVVNSVIKVSRKTPKPKAQNLSKLYPTRIEILNADSDEQKLTETMSGTTIKSVQKRNLMGRKNKIANSLAGNEQGIYVREIDKSAVSYITLAEILPGKSLDLYLALYKETHAVNPPKPFIRLTKNELREKSGILNQKTLNGHEKYLLAARIITRFTRSGDHTGSIYEVKKLSEVGVDATMQIEFERLLKD